MSQSDVHVDVAIIGGGIAGLWLLNRLCNQGYNAVLFEQDDLGGKQTIASQGMIHGGIKYALGGALTGSSEAIADMPEHWRRCLKGEGDVDLRKAKVLSEHFYLWSTASITSKFTSFFASKLTRGRVEKVKAQDYPSAFQSKAFKGNIYKLIDLVLDAPSLVTTLAANYADRIFHLPAESSWQQEQGKALLCIKQGEQTLLIRPQQFVFTAGKGNGALMEQLSISSPPMQLRPLQQVLVKHDYPHSLYAHCMGNNPSPRLTISSHQCADGKTAWYLGGDLATENTDTESGLLISKAKQELNNLFPWLDFSNAQWATLKIDRAEPKQKALIKPDKAFAQMADKLSNVIVAWPTKLTLAPNMADEIQTILDGHNLQPATDNSAISQLAVLPAPSVGQPCWDTLFK